MGHRGHCLQEKQVQKAQLEANTGKLFSSENMQHYTELTRPSMCELNYLSKREHNTSLFLGSNEKMQHSTETCLLLALIEVDYCV